MSSTGNRYNSQTNQTYNFQIKSDQNRIDSINFDFNIEQANRDDKTINETFTILRLYSHLTNETIINLSLQLINLNKYLMINGQQINIIKNLNYSSSNTKLDKIQFKFNSNSSFIDFYINSFFYLKIKYQNESNNGFYSLRIGSEICIENLSLNLFNPSLIQPVQEISLMEQYHNQSLNRYFNFFKISNKNCRIQTNFSESTTFDLINRQIEPKSSYYQCDQNVCDGNSTCENIMNYNYLGNLNAPQQQQQQQQFLNYQTTTTSPYLFISRYVIKTDYKCNCNDRLKYSGKNCSIKKSICDYEYACVNNGTCVQIDSAFNCLCNKNYVGERCEIYDPCKENLCSLYSTCQAKRQSIGYECICETGYMGQYCEIKISETCYLENQCKNNGKCIDKYDKNGNLKFECLCQSEFNGKNCENYIDYCSSIKPCKNNATCYNLRSTNTDQYACICPKGWKGLDCDEDIDECNDFPNLCKNNGLCNNLIGSFECNCKSEFFYGQYCENKHICVDDFLAPHEIKLCKNDGKCIIKGEVEENNNECECENGYEGESCALITCGTNPCRNNGTCVDLVLNETISSIHYECNCSNTGFIGPLCDDLIVINNETFICDSNSTLKCDDQLIQFQRIIMKASQIDNQENSFFTNGRPGKRDQYYHLVIWPLLGIMVVLIITLFGIFFVKMKKSRATRGTYSPSRHEQHSSRIEFNMDLKRPPEERLI